MSKENKEVILRKFEENMIEKSSHGSSLFTYYSTDNVRDSLCDEYLDKVMKQLHKYTSAVNSRGFQWQENNGTREFVFMVNDISHNLRYALDEQSIMRIYFDGQIVDTEEYDGGDSQKELDLFVEIWLLKYFKNRPHLHI